MIVHTTSTRTVEVPVDYGPVPAGWEKLTWIQKDWCLDEAKDRRCPVWAMAERVPSDKEILAQWEQERRDNRRENWTVVAFFIGVLVVLPALLFSPVWWPACWWPRDTPSWKCGR